MASSTEADDGRLTARDWFADRATHAVPYLLVIPGLIFVIGVLGYAVIGGFVLSVNETDMFLNKSFVGLRNYVTVFNDPRFQASLIRTIVFVICSITLGIVMSMIFALTLYHVGFGRRFFRGMSLVPYFVSGIATAVMFRFVFTTSGGFANFVLHKFGLPTPSWLGNPYLFFGGLTVIIWPQFEGGIFDLYSLVPGFGVSLVAIVVGSLLDSSDGQNAGYENFDRMTETLAVLK